MNKETYIYIFIFIFEFIRCAYIHPQFFKIGRPVGGPKICSWVISLKAAMLKQTTPMTQSEGTTNMNLFQSFSLSKWEHVSIPVLVDQTCVFFECPTNVLHWGPQPLKTSRNSRASSDPQSPKPHSTERSPCNCFKPVRHLEPQGQA